MNDGRQSGSSSDTMLQTGKTILHDTLDSTFLTYICIINQYFTYALLHKCIFTNWFTTDLFGDLRFDLFLRLIFVSVCIRISDGVILQINVGRLDLKALVNEQC